VKKFEGMVVHYNQRWVKRVTGAVAICFGRHVFTDASTLSEHTLAHEYCHVAQYGVYGFFGYLARWFYWTWKVGYERNPFEAQARTYADVIVPPRPYFYPGFEWSMRDLVPPEWLQTVQWSDEQGSLWPY